MKRVIALSDAHCGHVTGLTPPPFQYHPAFKKAQKALWKWYADKAKEIGPVDVILFCGDALDGRGKRSGGSELFEADMSLQASMAVEALSVWQGKPKRVHVHGTPYHEMDSDGKDWGGEVAAGLNAEIRDHAWIDVNGTIFDIKHKVGGSSVPYGRATAITKEAIWNLIWSEFEEANPRGDIFLRGHVHYALAVDDPNFLTMTLPALQGPGSKFGARQCSGTVHFGFVEFLIGEKGEREWRRHLLKFRAAENQAIKC